MSKKVAGSVVRNRFKRLVRECFRLNKNSISGGYDIVVVLKRSALNTYNKDLTDELKTFFLRL